MQASLFILTNANAQASSVINLVSNMSYALIKLCRFLYFSNSMALKLLVLFGRFSRVFLYLGESKMLIGRGSKGVVRL